MDFQIIMWKEYCTHYLLLILAMTVFSPVPNSGGLYLEVKWQIPAGCYSHINYLNKANYNFEDYRPRTGFFGVFIYSKTGT